MTTEEIHSFDPNCKGLAHTLGIEFADSPEPGVFMARMVVGEHLCQPFGILSGGALLALAEELAGYATTNFCRDRIGVGINVCANHLRMSHIGETLTATARIIQNGRTLHVWQVEIKNDAGELVSTATVTNYLVAKK